VTVRLEALRKIARVGRPSRCGLAVVAAVALGIVLSGCGSSSKSAAKHEKKSLAGKQATFVIFDTGQQSQFSNAFVDPVVRRTGLKVAFDAPTDYAKLQAQVQAKNVSWTVLEADPWWALGNCGTLIQRISVPVPGSPPKFPSGACGTPGDTFAFIVAYNGKSFRAHPPQGWKDFFDVKRFPGKRAVWGSYALNGALEGALLADGVPPNQLYPLDVERALGKLRSIKKDLVFYDQPGQAVQMMQAGTVAMAVVPSTQGYDQTQQGGSFKPIWNQALLSWDAYIVPVGANRAVARALLTQIASASGQATLAQAGAYGVTNPNARPKLSQAQEAWNPSGEVGGKRNEDQTIPFGQSYYAAHSNEVIQKWTNFVSG
jgi:putative spermidine/putrescine transport system substrate-binding protein